MSEYWHKIKSGILPLNSDGSATLWMLLIISSFLPLLAFGQNGASAVISPIASFQRLDSLNEENNLGLASPVVSYQFNESPNEVGITSEICSRVVSYQFYDSFLNAAASSAIISPIVSFQYFDWPNTTEVNFINSPNVSYFYQIDSLTLSRVLHGRVTDANGAALAGAIVSADLYNNAGAHATTDTAGNYQIPSVTSGIYDLFAVKSGYQTSIRLLTLNDITSVQDFQLKLLPPPPAILQVQRQSQLSYVSGPLDSELKIFDGTQFVSLATHTTLLSRDAMTIVLTHGWVPPLLPGPSGISGWPTSMAKTLRNKNISPNIANIVAWDWHLAASGIIPPQANTQLQGGALGTNLFVALGAQYLQPVHFLGHSLGSMVNAAAINFLHGERVPGTQADVSPTAWRPDTGPPIQVTLFDEAELSAHFSTDLQTSFDGSTVNQSTVPLLERGNNNSDTWSPPLPLHYTWAENYVSFVGFYRPNAVNILLQRGLSIVGVVDLHDYPMDWYSDSIENPLDPYNPLGFQRSFEFDKQQLLPPSNIPPTGLSDSYYQASQLDPLALSQIPFGLGSPIIAAYGTAAGTSVNTLVGVAQVIGDVKIDLQDAEQAAVQSFSQGVDFAEDLASEGKQTVTQIADSVFLRLTLHTGTPPQTPQMLQHRAFGLDGGDAGGNSPAMAWLPIQIPADETQMAFDFTVTGEVSGDFLVCGIGTNTLFSLQAKYIPTNAMSTSQLIDMQAWAGQQVELFVGFVGGTSTNATLDVQNIRFFSGSAPHLQARVLNNNLVLSWPVWANGYSLQTSVNIVSTEPWTPTTETPIIEGAFYSVTMPLSTGCNFYRLKLSNTN